MKSVEVKFRMGETFTETTVDDRQVQATLYFEDGGAKFIHTQVDKEGRKTVLERTLSRNDLGDEVMNIKMTVKGVVATAVFKKVK